MTAPTEAEIVGLIRNRYKGDEWVVLAQVPDGTGSNKRRTADALAMGLWPSRGLHLHGFEVKRTRSDVLAELKNPAKAESIAKWCDRWWLVIADPEHIKEGELPPEWGLLVVTKAGTGLRCVKDAPVREAPDHISKRFLAGLLRAHDRERGSDRLVEAAVVQANRRCGERVKEAQERASERYERLQRAVTEFEEASGVRITAYDAGEVGNAVRVVRRGGLDAYSKRLDGLVVTMERLVVEARDAAEALRPNE